MAILAAVSGGLVVVAGIVDLLQPDHKRTAVTPTPEESAPMTTSSGTTVAPPASSLLWSEEFDALDLASSLNPTGKWRANDSRRQVDKGWSDFGANGGSYNLNPAANLGNPFSVADSILTIKATRTNDAQRAAGITAGWVGGELISNTDLDEMTFGAGAYYEFRAQWPVHARGMFPALWFFAADGKNPGKGHAEIDLFEVFGYNNGEPWASTVHLNDDSGNGQSHTIHSASSETAGWHLYGLDWRADRIDIYHDRIKIASASADSAAWFAEAQMSIRVNYAMDATWFGSGQKSNASTPDSLEMLVDYIRKYDSVPPATS